MSKSPKDQAFDTDIGQKATVTHHVIENDPRMEQLREVLRDIALDMQETEKVPKGYKYMGSFSVHVYGAEALKGEYAFAGVNNYESCKFPLAEAACYKLREDIEHHFTGKRRTKRSGW
jgi:hypothetical protein